jgi:hypothetical protein
VREFRLGRDIAFKLNPKQALNDVLRIGFDKGVQFAVGDTVKDPTVRAYVLGGFGQMDLHLGIVGRRNSRARDFALGRAGLLEEKSRSNSQGE